MNKKMLPYLVTLSALLSPVAVMAAGTPAGTAINNTATVTYNTAGGPTLTVPSNVASVTVAELINVATASSDAGNVPTNTPDTDKVLTFTVTNTGNGTETYALSANRAVAGDQFDPTVGSVGSIFIENGLQAGFQATGPNADVAYIPGSNDPVLNANSATTNSKIIYVVSDIPAGRANGDLGKVSLSASSTTPGAAGATPGTSLAGLGDGGVDAVVGSTRATSVATGTFQVSAFSVVVSKTARVVDPFGGTNVVPGSTITYTISVQVTGTGTAQNLIVNDPLPANTTYVANTILFNGAARTDAIDADNAQISATGNVQATLGNVVAPATNTVVFKATVN